MSYYVCSKAVALQYCVGMKYIDVCQYNGGRLWVRSWNNETEKCTLLQRSVDEDTVLVLTLKDPLFRKVTGHDMYVDLLVSVGYPERWNILE